MTGATGKDGLLSLGLCCVWLDWVSVCIRKTNNDNMKIANTFSIILQLYKVRSRKGSQIYNSLSKAQCNFHQTRFHGHGHLLRRRRGDPAFHCSHLPGPRLGHACDGPVPAIPCQHLPTRNARSGSRPQSQESRPIAPDTLLSIQPGSTSSALGE